KRVEDLDQEKVRTYFTSLLKSGKFTQSYLFTGPKGTGKTTAARLLALILNCESNATAIAQGKALKDPCGKCDVCTSILEGGSSCVFEMDAASNRGIDDIRQLRERINLMPS